MKILAIDPGFERVGVAIIKRDEGKKDNLIYSSCFKTSPKLYLYERLNLIGKEIERLIEKYKPKALAIEKLYFTNNQKTAMGVAEARGTILFCATKAGLQIFEYTPLQIKVAVTGYGRATKRMVMDMVPKLIKVDASKDSDDEIDAIAAGLTCLACEKNF